MVKLKNDPLRLKWRGHPTEMNAEGRCKALRSGVSVNYLHHGGEFGIYLGGALMAKVQAPRLEGAKHRDLLAGYTLAKATAQSRVATWVQGEKADAARRKAQEEAATQIDVLREFNATKRKQDAERALKLADEIDRMSCEDAVGSVAGDAVELAALVKRLHGPQCDVCHGPLEDHDEKDNTCAKLDKARKGE